MAVRALLALVTLLATAAVPALAHTGAGSVSGFAAGFSHPIGGLDHMLAMIAVGLLGASLGGRWMWALPATFVAVMIAGGIAGVSGAPLPLVELGIKGSVVVLGLAIVFGANVSGVAAAALVAVFALFHGHAHGTEMPASVAALEYGAGFVAATAILHAVGLGLGLSTGFLAGRTGVVARQMGGGAIAALGLVVLLA
ncbi:urease accessory protein [Amorphus suaedae]